MPKIRRKLYDTEAHNTGCKPKLDPQIGLVDWNVVALGEFRFCSVFHKRMGPWAHVCTHINKGMA